jgi:putative CocE/NonD family hydrolase
MRRQAEATLAPKDWVNTLPVRDYALINSPQPSSLAPYFRDWILHERDDAYWQPWRVSDAYSRMTVMGLHAGGWHDIFLKGSIKNYTGLHQQASTAEARAGQRLMIGPWAHAPTSAAGKIGDVVFGKDAVVDQTAIAVKWFDYTLKGIKNEYASGAPVRLFIMGDNVWRDEQEFPLARTRYTKYYLHSTKAANSVTGDGMLSVAMPAAETKDEFDYDPQNPVRTIGGRLCCNAAFPPGPQDQRPNESRSDVLVFSTPALTEDTEVTGFVTLQLYAATSAVDTDFTALLVDVDPSGYARFLTDGIVRARYREDTTKGAEVVPGKVYQYTIELWATANVY